VKNLTRANYYVNIVGNQVFFADANGNGIMEPSEAKVAPPELRQFSTKTGETGRPARAVLLKDVYLSREPNGNLLQRFDRAREHEFRVMDVGTDARVTVQQSDGSTREVDSTLEYQEGDLQYSFLVNMISPNDPGRAGTLSGTYGVRLGTEDYGVDCAVTINSMTRTVSGNCGGEDLADVLSASDILYFELYLSGNGENILYRYDAGWTIRIVKPLGKKTFVSGDHVVAETTVAVGDPVSWRVRPNSTGATAATAVGIASLPSFEFVPEEPTTYEYIYPKQPGSGNNNCGRFGGSGCGSWWFIASGGVNDPNCGNGCKTYKSPPVSYEIVATRNGTPTARVIYQDEIDMIRQEYTNHDLTDMVPRRADFRPPTPTAHYSAAELNNTVYSVLPSDPGVLAERVMASFNAALSRDQQLYPIGARAPSRSTVVVGPGFDVVIGRDDNGDAVVQRVVTTPTCYPNPPDSCDDFYVADDNGLPVGIAAGDDSIVSTAVRRMPASGAGMTKPRISSGWRNPERNEAIGGAKTSSHQRGDALDLAWAEDAFPPYQGLSKAIGWCVLLQAASMDGVYAQAEIKDSIDPKPCVTDSITHVHVNWRR
jgi:hypothetical protein